MAKIHSKTEKMSSVNGICPPYKIGSVTAVKQMKFVLETVTFDSRAVKANFREPEKLFACLLGADPLDL